MEKQSASISLEQNITAISFITVMIIFNYWMMGIAITILNLGLFVSYFIWKQRAWYLRTDQVLPLYLAGIALQVLHLGEEYLTGFQTALPALVGDEWSDGQFLVFNFIWLFIFIAAAIGVFRKFTTAYLIVFFYAVMGGIMNGIAHPLLSIFQGNCFPGTFTALPALIVGVMLLRQLLMRESNENSWKVMGRKNH